MVKKINPKRFFTAIALIFGMLFASILPPGHVPDEPNHFFKAYQISLGQWKAQRKDQRLGGELPTSIIQLFEPFRGLRYHYDARINKDNFQQIAQLTLQPVQIQFQDFPNTAVYTPIGYAPQAMSIWIFRMLKVRPIVLFYLTRFLSLLIWIGMIRLSIAWIPFGKWLLAILALLPSSLWIHCGISADMMTNGIAFLLIAWLLKTIYGQPPKSKWSWLYPILFTMVLAATKIVYAPIFLLAILIPQSHFPKVLSQKSQTNKWIFISSGMLINLLIIFALYTSSKTNFIPYEDYNPAFREGQQINEGANPSQQFDYVIHHPIAFAKTMVMSYVGSTKATLAHYFGKFGWEKNYLPSWLIGLLLLVTLLLGSATTTSIKPNHRLLMIAIGIIMMMGFATVIYIQWSPIGSNRILSLAGRYMIPIFPLFYLTMPAFLRKHQSVILLFAQATIILSLSYGSWLILGRYYL